MSKIRVYELAKEIGLNSKMLAIKLQEMGYDVKNYSSTLEEDAEAEIRSRLEEILPPVEEKRIQGKGKTTIIRRRVKEVPVAIEEAPAAKPADEKAVVIEEGEEKPVTATVVRRKAAEEPVTETGLPATEEVVEQPVEEAVKAEAIPPAAVEAEIPVEDVKAQAPAETPADQKPEAVAEDTAPQGPAPQKLEAEPAAPAVRREVQIQPRKGLARVIKKAAITIAPPVAERPREPKPDRQQPFKRREPAREVSADKAAPDKAKKAKRFVKFSPEPVDRERLKKGGLKRKSEFDVDVDEVEVIGGRLPANFKFGRTPRGGGRKQKRIPQPVAAETKAIKKRIKVHESISVSDLAHRMGVKSNQLIAKLMELGVMATLNQAMDVETATLVAADFGYEVEQGETEVQTMISLEEQEQGGEMLPRPPVVTVMGHVDHGKTSILDAIRKTDVAAGEAGGITQHIGAHYVRYPKGDVVFLDTPGHAAFTEMRSRGAQVTDVVVLVVAADDGVMDQTKEAINHARAAGVPILVAVNKIDKPDADIMRVKRELSELGLMPEDWGGDTIYCETSAKQNIGIAELLDSILLQAEILELKADPNRRARGHVIEAQLHKGRGPVATVLVEQGTLHVGDAFVVGQFYGKVRSLFNDKGDPVEEATPAIPVEVHGLSGVPAAGDEFMVLPDEKTAKNISSQRQVKMREVELATTSKISLDNLFEKLKEEEIKELRVMLRADVQGTLEAFGSAIEQLSTEEIKVRILHSGTGTITESDILLAAASDALIIGFNVRPSAKVQDLAKKEAVSIRFYDVIYHALEDIKKAMVGMLEPTFEESVIGAAEVRQTFHVPKFGTIAGSYVTNGKIERNCRVRVLREGVVVYTGKLSSLKRFKDDAREVQSGYECGIGVENFNDIKVGDVLEAFTMEEVKREL